MNRQKRLKKNMIHFGRRVRTKPWLWGKTRSGNVGDPFPEPGHFGDVDEDQENLDETMAEINDMEHRRRRKRRSLHRTNVQISQSSTSSTDPDSEDSEDDSENHGEFYQGSPVRDLRRDNVRREQVPSSADNENDEAFVPDGVILVEENEEQDEDGVTSELQEDMQDLSVQFHFNDDYDEEEVQEDHEDQPPLDEEEESSQYSSIEDLRQIRVDSNSNSSDGGDSDPGDNSEEDPEEVSPNELLKMIYREWILNQLGRHCSTEVSNDFFSLMWKHCDTLSEIKRARGGIPPGLKELRMKIIQDDIPGLKMDFIFTDDRLPMNERLEFNNWKYCYDQDTFPRDEYPTENYTLLCQVTKMSFQDILSVHQRSCASRHHHITDRRLIMSTDGVNETKSTSRSFQVLSIQFFGCQEVYPVIICRPEEQQKKLMRPNFEAYMVAFQKQVLEAGFILAKGVMDAPERAEVRKQKMHGGYFSCDICLANPEKLTTEGSHSKKLIFPPHLRFKRIRTHEETEMWANMVENGEVLDIYGIKGKSVMFETPTFDVVRDLLPEPMHLLDAGFMKNTCGRTFNHGAGQQTKEGYRRTPIANLSNLLRKTVFPSDFPRRSRVYLHGSYKSHEWRQMGLFQFPLIIKSLEASKRHEKSVFLSFAFLARSMRQPQEEFEDIPEDMIIEAENILNQNYERAFGRTSLSYNIHIVASHLRVIREQGPLTQYTAYPFEGSYSELRRSFIPGTPNVSKQIFQKMMLRKFRPGHSCSGKLKPIRILEKAGKSRDDLIYLRENKKFKFYQVIEILDTELYRAVELNVEKKVFRLHPGLDFGLTGVFKHNGVKTIQRRIHLTEIAGKVVFSRGLLFAAPINILLER